MHVTFGADGAVLVDPPAQSDDDFSAFFDVKTPAAPATQALAQSATLRIENPTMRNAESVSCVACHVAGPLRQRAEMHWGITSVGNPNMFTAPPFDLAATSGITADATALRAFGYRDRSAVISQWVVNESAAVAGYLNEAHDL